ncbi:MAG: hypothetical protein ABJA94_04520, partial [Rhodoglobus sp.]
IAQDGGVNPERISSVVTSERLPTEIDSLNKYQSRKVKATGSTSFDTPSLAQYSQDADGIEIDVYVCVDVEAVRIFDSSGVDVTPERANRLPVQVGFQSNSSDWSALRLSSSDVWTGDDYCVG